MHIDLRRRLPFRLRWLLAAAMLVLALPAEAAVEATFYSREFGSQFPHGFVTIEGTLDRGGERIDTNYGFTATHVTPALLWGSVRGRVEAVGAGYRRGSDAHFALTLSDTEYDRMMEEVARWRDAPQPSYNLNRRNCVHFIAALAAAIGMRAEVPRNLTRRPESFLETLIRSNLEWLAARPGARILRDPGPAPAERRARRGSRRGGAED